jgi:hypothetical protein
MSSNCSCHSPLVSASTRSYLLASSRLLFLLLACRTCGTSARLCTPFDRTLQQQAAGTAVVTGVATAHTAEAHIGSAEPVHEVRCNSHFTRVTIRGRCRACSLPSGLISGGQLRQHFCPSPHCLSCCCIRAAAGPNRRIHAAKIHLHSCVRCIGMTAPMPAPVVQLQILNVPSASDASRVSLQPFRRVMHCWLFEKQPTDADRKGDAHDDRQVGRSGSKGYQVLQLYMWLDVRDTHTVHFWSCLQVVLPLVVTEVGQVLVTQFD